MSILMFIIMWYLVGLAVVIGITKYEKAELTLGEALGFPWFWPLIIPGAIAEFFRKTDVFDKIVIKKEDKD